MSIGDPILSYEIPLNLPRDAETIFIIDCVNCDRLFEWGGYAALLGDIDSSRCLRGFEALSTAINEVVLSFKPAG